MRASLCLNRDSTLELATQTLPLASSPGYAERSPIKQSVDSSEKEPLWSLHWCLPPPSPCSWEQEHTLWEGLVGTLSWSYCCLQSWTFKAKASIPQLIGEWLAPATIWTLPSQCHKEQRYKFPHARTPSASISLSIFPFKKTWGI